MGIQRNRAAWWRPMVLVVFLLLALLLGLLVPLPSVDQIQREAREAGWWGVLLFIAGYALVTLTPIPKSVVSVAAGITWGFGVGFGVVYAGALLGAAAAFAFGRWLGRDTVERFTGARVARVDAMLRRRGFATLITARLIPLLPFTVINYSAGLTSVRRRDYALSTLLGIIPGTLAYVAVGAYGMTIGWQFYLALAALAILTLGGVWVGARMRRADHAAATPHASAGPTSDA